MKQEEMNTQLYEKLAAEQTKYRDWLMGQPPEEILNHAYEYAVREDILAAAELMDIPQAQAAALLAVPSPMEAIYGGGVAAGKAPGPALYHSGLDLRISQTKTAPTLKKRRGCSYMCQERRAAFGNHPYHAPAHGQGPERGQRHPRYSGLC